MELREVQLDMADGSRHFALCVRYCVETRRQDDRMMYRQSAGRYTQIREIE